MSELSRRDFLKVSGGALASGMVFGCGHEHEQHPETLPQVERQNQLSDNAFLDEPATAYEQAERLNPPDPPKPVPPPKTWRAGDFVLKADIDFPGVALNYDDGPSPYNT